MPKISYNLGDLQTILKKEKPSNVCIVTSKNIVAKLGWAFREMDIPKSRVIFVPDGEKAKEWPELQKLLKEFSLLRLDRSSIVCVVGGGTVGDLAGFACSMYLRGIRYVQIPTTLVAQVDSAHGGKTGINFLGIKNQLGSFYEPAAIIMDIRFIRGLPEPAIVDGLGEIIKCGLIKDDSIIRLLKKERVSTIAGSASLKKLIGKTVKVKQYFTNQDRKDTDARQMLNFGHTFGHAIELRYRISHGYAVIIGMLQELAFTQSVGMTSPVARKNLTKLLSDLGIQIDRQYMPDIKLVIHDKKMVGNKITLPIVQMEGKSKLVRIAVSKVVQFLKSQ